MRAGFWAIDLALTAVTVFFLVKVGGHLFFRTSATPPPPLHTVAPKPVDIPAEVRPPDQYASLKKSNLFGALSSANVDAQKAAEEKLAETVDLELLGSVAGGDPGSSFAIIRDKRSRSEGTYGIGDFIANSARVEEIRENEVVVSRGGRREIVAMSFTDENAPGEAMFAREMGFPRPNAARFQPGFQQGQPSGVTDVAIRVVNENLRYVNREKLKQEAKGSVGQLLGQLSTAPNTVDNKPNGIRVNGLGSDPLVGQSGLQPGDVVKSVNGIRVNSLDEALGLGERLQNSPEIRVVIERNGRHRTLVYKLR
ncbi:hypothetical protein HZA56_19175 [Candidatus Poribacteria bacterium]|nr:hypothetical protein [Candidatus Poribacteria bacterium]